MIEWFPILVPVIILILRILFQICSR